MDKPALAVALNGNVWLSFARKVSLVEKLDATPDGFIHYQLLRFARPPASCILMPTFSSIIDALCNSNTLISK
jgi:hypothetical protein